ncbi:MAG: DDE-type integrase/transposase/recombinase [Candidatus Falkowbacteria bacterium]
MLKYNILSDFAKQKKLKEVEVESKRLNKSKYWILMQMGMPKSTYYDWLAVGGISKSKAPINVWNKTPEVVEKLIVQYREDISRKQSERSFVGIAHQLETVGVYMTEKGVWSVLKRKGKSNQFKERKKIFIIFPKGQKFLEVVCIDDIGLTNKKPRELSIFNAIDEYSGRSVAISFVKHRINRWDVIDLLERIENKYGRFPKIVRLDNAKAHISKAVKKFCLENNIKLQFIDPGTPQQNWPVEAFNGVIQKDLLYTVFWGDWIDLANKQKILEEYAEYYNNVKPLKSDPLERTPNEIATAITSPATQQRLKIRLIRKHYGQVAATREAFKNITKNQLLLPLVICPKCA